MRWQGSQRVESRSPRWWPLTAVGGLVAVALLLAGLLLPADAASKDRSAVRAEPDKKEQEPPKKEESRTAPDKDPARKAEPKPAPDPGRRDVPGPDAAPPAPGIGPDTAQTIQSKMDKLIRSGASAEQMHKEMMKLMKELGLPIPDGGFGGLGPMAPGDMRHMLGHRPGQAGPQSRRLGATIDTPSATLVDQLDLPQGQGLVIEEVRRNSPAGKAGLKPHDILLELNGKPVPSETPAFLRQLKEIKADTAMDVVVLRKGKKETLKGLSLPEAKDDDDEQPGPGIPGFQPPGIGLGGLPIMPPFGAGRFPGFPQVFPPGAPGGGAGVMTTVTRTGDRITSRYQEGTLVITLVGTVAEGKATIKEISVQDGAVARTYETVDKVPEQYRDKVKNLLEVSEKGNVRIEIKAP